MLSISLSDSYGDTSGNFFYYTHGRPGLYSIYESAFYLDKENFWIAFLSSDNNAVTVYAPPHKTEKDIPGLMKEWIDGVISKGKDKKLFSKNLPPRLQQTNRRQPLCCPQLLPLQ